MGHTLEDGWLIVTILEKTKKNTTINSDSRILIGTVLNLFNNFH